MSNIIDWDKHKFRCHQLGYLMTEPKGKSNEEKYNESVISLDEKRLKADATVNKTTATYFNLLKAIEKLEWKIDYLKPIKHVPLLSGVCKAKLAEIYTSFKYNRSKDIKAKYFEKGILLEEDAITAYSMLTGKFHEKNKVRKYNEFIEGEMDFEDDEDYALDTKVSWDIFTFNATQFSPINPIYEWQLDGYMWLFNKSKAKLVYALLDTPEHLIVAEERKLLFDFIGSEVDYKEACAEIRRNHTYSDIPLEEKIRIFETVRSDERIDRIKQRVKDCRYFLNNIENIKPDEEDETED